MLEVNPTVAKFYYYSSLRMSKGLTKNHDIEALLPDTKSYAETKLATKSATKTIHYIMPHETARLTAEHAKNISLCTLLKGDRFAIIIQDKRGNVSLTCIDKLTSLDVIKREVTAMKFKSGEFTIDVVKLDSVPERNAADLKILPYIATTFGGRVLNSKNTAVSRSTKSEAVLLQFDEKTHVYKLLCPLLNDVMHRTPHVINLKRYGLVAPSKSKALDSWVVNQGSKPFQSRLSERLIVREMDPEFDELPTVVFNDGWTDVFPTVTPKMRTFINVACAMTDVDKVRKLIANTMTYPCDEKLKLAFIESMVGHINQCKMIRSNSLYHTLQVFFSKPHTTLPDAVIGNITGYAESQDLLDLRINMRK